MSATGATGTSARLEALGAALERAGVTVSLSTNVHVAIWEKLLFVGPVGMVGAATGLSADRFRAIPQARELVVRAMEEIRLLASTRRVSLSSDAVTAALARLDTLPAGSTTSMQRDLEAGRPSELEEQVGVVVRMAKAVGLDVPVHRVLHAVLSSRAVS